VLPCRGPLPPPPPAPLSVLRPPRFAAVVMVLAVAMEGASKARTISAPLTREKRCGIEALKYLLQKKTKKTKKKRILCYYCYYLYSLGFRFSVNCNRVWTSVVLNYCVEDKWCLFLRGLQRPGTDVLWGFRFVISDIEEAVFLSGVGHDEGG